MREDRAYETHRISEASKPKKLTRGFADSTKHRTHKISPNETV
jgi:hypothetical protein